MNPPRSAGDGRQEVQLTVMIPIERPVLGNLAGRLVVKILIRVARVKELSVPVPVPRRSAPAVITREFSQFPTSVTNQPCAGLGMHMEDAAWRRDGTRIHADAVQFSVCACRASVHTGHAHQD